jgi:hypothetical protein
MQLFILFILTFSYKTISSERRCMINVLKKLGYQTYKTRQKESSYRSYTGNCLDFKQAEFFIGKDQEDFKNKFLQAISIENRSNYCQFKKLYSKGAKSAAEKLQSNSNYTFSTSGMITGKVCESNLWISKEVETSFGPIYCSFPSTKYPSEALTCFYEGTCYSECLRGMYVALYLNLLEVYGPNDFDRVYNSTEISIGISVDSSNSPYFKGRRGDTDQSLPLETLTYEGKKYQKSKSNSNEVHREESTKSLIEMDYLSLIGVNGRISSYNALEGNENGFHLDSRVDRGENFIITDISQEAYKALIKNGLVYYERKLLMLHFLLKKAFEFKSLEARQNFSQLLHLDKKNNAIEKLNGESKKAFQQLKLELNNPFFQGTKIYVHPFGEKTLKFHLRRLFAVNPRVPYFFTLYKSNINSSIFHDFINFYQNKCFINK